MPGIALNDPCNLATPLTLGVPATQNNYNATPISGGGGPEPTSNLYMSRDLWFSFVAPSCSTFVASDCGGTNFDSGIAVWQGSCGSLVEIAVNDDACIPGDRVTFSGVLGTTYYISVGSTGSGFSAMGTFTLTVTEAPPPMTLAFFGNGPGTIGYTVTHGPPNGMYPNGWFHGIDISVPDLFSEWAQGYPYVAPVGNGCSPIVLGPFGGLPPGLHAYGVALGLPSGGPLIPTRISAPATFVVP